MLKMIFHTLQSIDYSIFHFINQTISNAALDVFMLFIRNAYTWIPLYITIFFYLILRFKLQMQLFAEYKVKVKKIKAADK